MELPAGRVIIELAPRFAPQHVANIKQLVAEKFFDGLAVVRVQDNFVAQWGDADKTAPARAAAAQDSGRNRRLPGARACRFIKLPDRGRLRARDRLDRRLPRGRGSQTLGPGVDHALLRRARRGPRRLAGHRQRRRAYVVIGQAPRQLDRNIVTVGRVLRGIELLSSLPRGTGALGFYEKPEQRAPIKSIRARRRRSRSRADPSKSCAPTRRCSRSTSSRAAIAATAGTSCPPATPTSATSRSPSATSR